MQDWTAGQLRYLVHFDDGGSGDAGCATTRSRPAASWTTAAFVTVVRVEPPTTRHSFGHAWAEVRDEP